jgi:ribosomal protein S10
VFVTTLRLTGGDRAALDSAVASVRETVERKGAELKGPHTHPHDELSVPLYARSPPTGEELERWRYDVYRRELSIVGHADLAREVAGRDFPDSVRVEVEVDRRG